MNSRATGPGRIHEETAPWNQAAGARLSCWEAVPKSAERGGVCSKGSPRLVCGIGAAAAVCLGRGLHLGHGSRSRARGRGCPAPADAGIECDGLDLGRGVRRPDLDGDMAQFNRLAYAGVDAAQIRLGRKSCERTMCGTIRNTTSSSVMV